MNEIKESYELIATRVPPGDRWALTGNKEKIYNSITDTLEAYFHQTKNKCDFKLAPLKGELYAILIVNKEPEPPKKFNIYGDY